MLVFVGQEIFAQLQGLTDKTLLLRGRSDLTDIEMSELDTLWTALKFYRSFNEEETKLNGKSTFGFSGNESELNNIFKINAGVQIDKGIYPYELDLKSNFQTLINNGEFQENVSDIDISLDYHPKVGNGLVLETYVFLSRFNNTYLGIEQRYEAGTGFVINFFTTRHLTSTGQSNKRNLDKLPDYKLVQGNVWKCYNEVCHRVSGDQNTFSVTEDEIAFLDDIRYNYDKANKKKYAKLRLALLAGIYYENEKARIEQQLMLNNGDSLYVEEFDATNKLRWELRPTLVLRPTDIFTIKLYPYFKLPLRKWMDVVRFDENTVDERIDMFYDFQASITTKVTENISVNVNYRYLKDFAPKRSYQLDANNQPQLRVGQETNSFYSIDFSFGF